MAWGVLAHLLLVAVAALARAAAAAPTRGLRAAPAPAAAARQDAGVPSCPAGHFCASPGAATPCPLGAFCSQGVAAPAPCSMAALVAPPLAAVVVAQPNVTAGRAVFVDGAPLLGNYCPPGAFTPLALCPAGSYCADAARVAECPAGHFCLKGSFEPRACPPGAACPAGSSFYGPPPLYLAAIAAALLLAVAAYAAVGLAARRANRRSHARLMHGAELDQLLAPLVGPAAATASSGVLTAIRPRVSLRCEELGLVVRSGAVLLAGVTADFPHSALHAVMGPSGAGKTSFFNAIRGTAAAFGAIRGAVRVNGARVEGLRTVTDVTAFVPQDDVVHETLTVRENLESSARLRLSASVSAAARAAVVDEVLELLGLAAASHRVVGARGGGGAGVSGGQRKRVSVGIELVMAPSLLLMDEPTSGLDATAASSLIVALKTLAAQGVNAVSIIHQPRFSAFALFDSVLLLQGGRTVFQGPTGKVLSYFEGLGFAAPPHENPADFVLDVIAGSIECAGDAAFVPATLPAIWAEGGAAALAKCEPAAADAQAPAVAAAAVRRQATAAARGHFAEHGAAAGDPLTPELLTGFLRSSGLAHDARTVAAALRELGAAAGADEPLTVEALLAKLESGPASLRARSSGQRATMRRQFSIELQGASAEAAGRSGKGGSRRCGCRPRRGGGGNRRAPSCLVVYGSLLRRAAIKAARDWPAALAFFLLVLVLGVCAFAIIGPSAEFGFLNRRLFASYAHTPQLLLGMIVSVASCRIFGDARGVHARETAAGLPTGPLFLAAATVHLFELALLSLVCAALYFLLVSPTFAFGPFFAAMLGVAWWASGAGYVASVLLAPKNALVLSVALNLVVNNALDGVQATPFAAAGALERVAVGLSYTRWASEAVAITAWRGLPPPYQPAAVARLAEIGFCGLAGRAVDPAAAPSLADTTVDAHCGSSYLRNDWVALFCLGAALRLLACARLWVVLRPERRGASRALADACRGCAARARAGRGKAAPARA